MTRRRILIFSLAYHPFVGGAEVAIKELTDRLPDYDWEMITLNLDGQQVVEEQIGNVRVFRLPGGKFSKIFYPWRAFRWAAARHQTTPYQLVWSMMANQAGMAGAKFKKLFRAIPFLLTLQEGDDLDSLSYRAKLFLPKIFGVFRLPDQLQVISRYLEKWARKMGATCPITVIPNGVDLNKFEARSTKSETNSNDQNSKSEKIIITTSRLVKKNGISDLIKSLTFLPDNVKLQILGEGPDQAKLESLVDQLKLASRVSFLGQVDNSALTQYLAQADVFCRPSLSEGLGNSFLEAMAVGLPTIGTPVGGIPDFLKAGETGWLCRVKDPASIAEQVKFILEPENRVQVEAVITRARALILAKYNWDQLAPSFSQLLISLARQG